MVLANRIFFLLVFSLFWGGLTFYTGFVVRVSHRVLDDAMLGGLITQGVTNVLQMLGVLAVIVMGINAFVVTKKLPRLGYLLWGLAAVVGLSIIGLYIVHGHLDAVIDTASATITDDSTFRNGHRHYNQLTTVEWIASLFYLGATVAAWRSIDRESISETKT